MSYNKNLTDVEFIKLCTDAVSDYVREHLDKSDPAVDFGVYVVWQCKCLQNNKAMLSTTLPDGMYYECTYNGDKGELYFDAYKKFQNKTIKVGEE